MQFSFKWLCAPSHLRQNLVIYLDFNLLLYLGSLTSYLTNTSDCLTKAVLLLAISHKLAISHNSTQDCIENLLQIW